MEQLAIGNHRLTCPECSHRRKNKNEKCFSVRVTEDEILGYCHHCSHKIKIRKGENGKYFRGKRNKRDGSLEPWMARFK